MARIRTVKPEYPKHRKVRKVSRDARLLNIHLWNLADDEGRLQELPRWIIGEVFPADEDVTPEVLVGWLDELAEVGLIDRYEFEGERYIAIHGWRDHQKISHPGESTLPPPPSLNGSRRATGTLREDSGNVPGTFREDSGNVPGGKGTGNREQGTGKGSGEFDDWLAHYNEVTGSRARGSKDARRKFNARRREGRSLADLKLATVGCNSSAYNRENGHVVPETILRESKVDRYVKMGEAASGPDKLAEMAAREAA